MTTYADFGGILNAPSAGWSWLWSGTYGRAAVVTYSFPTHHLASHSGSSGWSETDASFQAFNDTDKALARAALKEFQDASGGAITFVEVNSDDADILYNWDSSLTVPGSTGIIQGTWDARSGDVRINTSAASNEFNVLLHETGHAVGFYHPTDPNTATIMAGGTRSQLTALDISAIQFAYGDHAGAGWSYFNWDPATVTLTRVSDEQDETIVGTAVNDVMDGGPGNNTFYGGGGLDTVIVHARYSDAHLTSDTVFDIGRETIITIGSQVQKVEADVERIRFNDATLEFDRPGGDFGGGTLIRVPGYIPHNFNGDGFSDVLWNNTSSGAAGEWQISGGHVTGWVPLGNGASPWSIAGTGDFNGDGTTDVLWRNSSSGDVGYWRMANNTPTWVALGNGAAGWQIAGVGDFNGDGLSDVLWRNSASGDVGDWQVSNNGQVTWNALGNGVAGWQVAGIGDFNGDGTSDVLWNNTSTGDTGDWQMSNGHVASWNALGNGSSPYQIAGVGDFNGDGTSDVLWHNANTGDVGDWQITNNHVDGWAALGTGAAPYQIAGVGDYNGDGTSDVLWRNTNTGDVGDWAVTNNHVAGWNPLGNGAAGWQIVNS